MLKAMPRSAGCRRAVRAGGTRANLIAPFRSVLPSFLQRCGVQWHGDINGGFGGGLREVQEQSDDRRLEVDAPSKTAR